MMHGNVFQVNDGGLFNEMAHTQGGLQHLMQHLWDAYAAHLAEKLEERKKAGQPATTLAEAKKRAPATHFAQWATEYLKENRVVENFFIDENHGIRLANNVAVAICPGTVIQGTMQDSGAIQVTEGRGQKNTDVQQTQSLRI